LLRRPGAGSRSGRWQRRRDGVRMRARVGLCRVDGVGPIDPRGRRLGFGPPGRGQVRIRPLHNRPGMFAVSKNTAAITGGDAVV
jgi:hypothetical protein